jgi:hypothetical protein
MCASLPGISISTLPMIISRANRKIRIRESIEKA